MIFLPAVHNFPFWWSSSELPTSKPPPPPPPLLHVLWFLKNIFMEINIEMNFSSCIWARGRGSRNARCASLEERAVIHKIETCLRERTEARQKLVASRCFVYFLYICWSCKISSFCSCCWFWAFPLNLFFWGGERLLSGGRHRPPDMWYLINLIRCHCGDSYISLSATSNKKGHRERGEVKGQDLEKPLNLTPAEKTLTSFHPSYNFVVDHWLVLPVCCAFLYHIAAINIDNVGYPDYFDCFTHDTILRVRFFPWSEIISHFIKLFEFRGQLRG